jgi:transcriptional regulator with AAA-type ATPase domain
MAVQVPVLRERKEDILRRREVGAKHWVAKMGESFSQSDNAVLCERGIF